MHSAQTLGSILEAAAIDLLAVVDRSDVLTALKHYVPEARDLAASAA